MLADPTQTTAEGYLRRATKLKQRRMAALGRLALASPRRAKRSARDILVQPDIIAATLLAQLKKMGVAVGGADGVSAEEIIGLSGRLDIWSPTSEFVAKLPKPRANGGTRWVHRLGLLESTRQRLLREVAAKLVALHPNQFMLNGGPPALDRWLRVRLPFAQAIITTDIPSCHDTIKWSCVADGLPLPRRVMEVALRAPMARAKPLVPGPKGKEIPLKKDHPYYEDYIVGASSSIRGIPSGAALSSIASEVVIKKVLDAAEAAAPGVFAGALSDNLIFLLTEASNETSVFDAVASAVNANFGLDVLDELARRKTVTQAGDWFFYCGHLYRWNDGVLDKRTEEQRIENFALRTEVKLAEAASPADKDHIRSSIAGWASQQMHSRLAIRTALELAEKLGAS